MSIIWPDGGDVRLCEVGAMSPHFRCWRQGWRPAGSLGSLFHQWKEVCSPWRIQLVLRCVSKAGELVVLMMVFGVYCLSLLAAERESNLEIRGATILDLASGKNPFWGLITGVP